MGNIRDTGQVPLFLASQLLAVLLRSKGRCHPPQINNMLLFLSFWHSFISSPVPYTQAQTSSVLKFPTNYLLTKLEQPKLLEDFGKARRVGAPQPCGGLQTCQIAMEPTCCGGRSWVALQLPVVPWVLAGHRGPVRGSSHWLSLLPWRDTCEGKGLSGIMRRTAKG